MTAFRDITFVTTSFHDQSWIKLQLRQIRKTTPEEAINSILIIDQDRTIVSRNRLARLDKKSKVFQYERNEACFKVAGHDHPAVLNQIIKQVSSEFCCIFDSDAHPMSKNWFKSCENLLSQYDCILAQDPLYPWVCHPCFMVLRKSHLSHIDFGELFLDAKFDTGRLVANQLQKVGVRVFLIPFEKAFNGKWGDVYLGSIYHHGNGSFAGGDERLKWQVSLENKSFRDLVIYWRKYREPSKYGIIFRLLRRYRRYKLSQSKIREIGTKVVLPPYNGPVALKEQLIDSCNSSNGPSAPI
ncbi:MAG: hypothetical protein ACLQSR_02970 [Limisphaerales bacterium]